MVIQNNSSYRTSEIDPTIHVCKLTLLGKHNDNRYLLHMKPNNIMTCLFLDQKAMVSEYITHPQGMFLVQFFYPTNSKYKYFSRSTDARTIASIKLIADFPQDIKDTKEFADELRTRVSDVYNVNLNNRDITITRK